MATKPGEGKLLARAPQLPGDVGIKQPGSGPVLALLGCSQVPRAGNAVGFPNGQSPTLNQLAAAFRLFLSMKLKNCGALTAVLSAQIGTQVGIVPISNHQHPLHGSILLLNSGPNGLTDVGRRPTVGARHSNHPNGLHATGRDGPGLPWGGQPTNFDLNRDTAHGWDLPPLVKALHVRCAF